MLHYALYISEIVLILVQTFISIVSLSTTL